MTHWGGIQLTFPVTCPGGTRSAVLEIPVSYDAYMDFAHKDAENLSDISELESRERKQWLRMEECIDDFERFMLRYKLDALLKIPKQILERDATRRCFEWLREVRKRTGADFFKLLRVERSRVAYKEARTETVVAEQGCEELVTEAVRQGEEMIDADVHSFLRKALASYGARGQTMRRFRRDRDDDYGLFPSATLDAQKRKALGKGTSM